ncbi:acetyl-CoA hydrolase/transferase C-terminal domain-containing protein [Marinicella gelatinilytica]|uniref:acetyl-CoA hydrolase/transferase C-terminal domain-containing protein n=1 Tax=Marinicella gelatinilytica TaxID=2996017 RepID=UPI002260E13B|nr:acetyl-CoA hydrolase/transferase C-terminal domain-containing protein [Marinicella gelatinilytica]MCX7545754.1 acetyl-CoA hydrolase [Marinicella gelatinilytica]
MPLFTQENQDVVDFLHHKLGNNWHIGTPLGIGKPNPLVNALYHYVVDKPDIEMSLFTALSLEVPKGDSLLEQRFLTAFTGRHFKSYPELSYIEDIKKDRVPQHIHLKEFYFQSGQFLGTVSAQQNYISCNYTHVARDMVNLGINVIVQMIAVDRRGEKTRYSLSCNPDLTLDVVRIADYKNRPRPLIIAMVNEELPFLEGEAVVDADFFDVIVDNPNDYFQPYAPPARPISAIDHSIGLHVSTLIRDKGTLQIGIGSLADAVVYSSILRDDQQQAYRDALTALDIHQRYDDLIAEHGSTKPFEHGLFAASEMFVEGFMHLYKSGIIKRKVYEDADIQRLLNEGQLSEQVSALTLTTLLDQGIIHQQLTERDVQRLQKVGIFKDNLTFLNNNLYDGEGNKLGYDLNKPKHLKRIAEQALNSRLGHGAVLHAAFFLGSKRFYQFLRELSDAERQLFLMTPVSQINQLYRTEAIDRAQRINARFINTCMKVDVTGAAISDTLENHQVVSGVGGQYNFVAMAHALRHSRSILMLKSTHGSGQKRESNIVWQYPECTIPRHLRDIVVTEYGMADLRGQSDEVCIQRLISIADSQFQEGLRQTAVQHGKLKADWQIPEHHRHNTPAKIKQALGPLQQQKLFPQYPFGHDFTEQEQRIIKALTWLKKQQTSRWQTLKLLAAACLAKADDDMHSDLQLMQFNQTRGIGEKLMRRLLIHGLQQTRH